MSIKLSKLPNRTPVKMTVVFQPDTHSVLADYRQIYEQTYGSKECIEDLIPFMVMAFLEGDNAFKKARKQLKSLHKSSQQLTL